MPGRFKLFAYLVSWSTVLALAASCGGNGGSAPNLGSALTAQKQNLSRAVTHGIVPVGKGFARAAYS